jgi:hypothetical protein
MDGFELPGERGADVKKKDLALTGDLIWWYFHPPPSISRQGQLRIGRKQCEPTLFGHTKGVLINDPDVPRQTKFTVLVDEDIVALAHDPQDANLMRGQLWTRSVQVVGWRCKLESRRVGCGIRAHGRFFGLSAGNRLCRD